MRWKETIEKNATLPGFGEAAPEELSPEGLQHAEEL